jgi:hypothetical protein
MVLQLGFGRGVNNSPKKIAMLRKISQDLGLGTVRLARRKQSKWVMMFVMWNMTSLCRLGSRRWPGNWQGVDSIEWVCRWVSGTKEVLSKSRGFILFAYKRHLKSSIRNRLFFFLNKSSFSSYESRACK